jgi:DNA-3-methyladenine glycosylase II
MWRSGNESEGWAEDGRFLALFRPRRFLPPDQVLAAPGDSLRAAGLSRGKSAAPEEPSAKTNESPVMPLRALSCTGEEEIVERVTRVLGIGRWTLVPEPPT